ncbi:MAG: glycosyltransferase family 2 protein [Elusimicrobiota bacterium]|nr:glycosyltransferase family 2 protein [Elusimicrobiota bacterium]
MKKIISIITSAYNEQGCVEELARQLVKVFENNPKYEFEAIIVENGSTDGTFEKLLEIRSKDSRFKIVRLSRNFRMDGGITAGLNYARGDAAVLMTSNLQDSPEIINKFIEKWEQGYEHVYGIVKARPGKRFFRRLNSQLFYLVINYLTDNMIPKNVSDFRLMDRRMYATINRMEERNRFMRGLFAWVGFKSAGVEFERAKRFAGESHAPFWKVVELAIKGILAFSYVPIQAISVFGLALSFISLLYFIFTVVKVLVYGVPFAGYGTIVSLILLLFGFVFLILGILGQYIAQIYEEVKGRPNFIVKELHGLDLPSVNKTS